MGDIFERTFSVSVPPARAWRAFMDPAELEVCLRNGSRAAVPTRSPTPWHRARGSSRHWAESPDDGIELTVVFEATENGKRSTRPLKTSCCGSSTASPSPVIANLKSRAGVGAEFARVPGGLGVTRGGGRLVRGRGRHAAR